MHSPFNIIFTGENFICKILFSYFKTENKFPINGKGLALSWITFKIPIIDRVKKKTIQQICKSAVIMDKIGAIKNKI